MLHSEDKGYLKCEHCSRMIKGKGNLSRHIKQLHGTNVGKCDICNETFSLSYLSDHKLRKHSDSNPCCKICEKVFSSIRDLRVHNNRIHVKSEVDIYGKMLTKMEINETLFKNEN